MVRILQIRIMIERSKTNLFKMSKCFYLRRINCLRWKISSNFILLMIMRRFRARLEWMLRWGCYRSMIRETPRNKSSLNLKRDSKRIMVWPQRGTPWNTEVTWWLPKIFRIQRVLERRVRCLRSSSRWTSEVILTRLLNNSQGSKRCQFWNCNLTAGPQVEAKVRLRWIVGNRSIRPLIDKSMARRRSKLKEEDTSTKWISAGPSTTKRALLSHLRDGLFPSVWTKSHTFRLICKMVYSSRAKTRRATVIREKY